VKVRVLGSAAGGGFPQWNCGCRLCLGVRAGTLRARARTQAQLAVSARGAAGWYLLGASPDLGSQLAACPPLHPRGPRDTPIAGIVLGNGDLDHVLGLFALRESQPLVVWATERVWRGLAEGNAIWRTLERFPGQVRWERLVLGEERPLADGLAITALAVPGKPPLHLASAPPSAEDTVAIRLREQAGGPTLVYAPTVGGRTPLVERLAAEADLLFFDGTFWTSGELGGTAPGAPRAEAMAHWPLSGTGGSLELLERAPGRRWLIHVNNTNPILDEDSPERASVRAAGVHVAEDGLAVDTDEEGP
jgi:pyrroloquinoline quinone biosynthesis protein B